MSAVALPVREPGAAYSVGVDAARKVHLYRLYQTRTYEGALLGRSDREANRRIIERAFALARQRLRFRGVPQLIPVRPRAAADSGTGELRLPDILCIGEFVWARPVRDRTRTCSSATLVWFQDSFALPVASAVIDDMREVSWSTIAEDWSW